MTLSSLEAQLTTRDIDVLRGPAVKKVSVLIDIITFCALIDIITFCALTQTVKSTTQQNCAKTVCEKTVQKQSVKARDAFTIFDQMTTILVHVVAIILLKSCTCACHAQRRFNKVHARMTPTFPSGLLNSESVTLW